MSYQSRLKEGGWTPLEAFEDMSGECWMEGIGPHEAVTKEAIDTYKECLSVLQYVVNWVGGDSFNDTAAAIAKNVLRRSATKILPAQKPPELDLKPLLYRTAPPSKEWLDKQRAEQRTDSFKNAQMHTYNQMQWGANIGPWNIGKDNED